MIVKYNKTNKYVIIYNELINFIEEYNLKILSTKVYWDKPDQKDEYKKFWNKYQSIQKITDEVELKKQKEILFIKEDLKFLNRSKNNYKEIIKIYKNILVEFGVMRKLENNVKIGQVKKYKGKILAIHKKTM